MRAALFEIQVALDNRPNGTFFYAVSRKIALIWQGAS